MIKNTLALIAVIAIMMISIPAMTQSRSVDYVDGTFAIAQSRLSLSLGYNHLWKVGKSEKFYVGAGIRFTSFSGTDQYYITAPAAIANESTSPFILFQKNITRNIDSLFVPSPQAMFINVSMNVAYRISRKILVGFNIDAIGFSFGARKQTTYVNGTMSTSAYASLTPFNILLIHNNDRGSLNSELFARYRVDSKWSMKAAIQLLTTEYTTETKVQQYPIENDRFRRNSLMLGIGVCYQMR